jgi:hypothetical protein
MSGLTRRELLLANAGLLGTQAHSFADEKPKKTEIASSSIPEAVQIVGLLKVPVCTLVKFSGEWIIQYDHYVKGDTLHLRVDVVNHMELEQPAEFPCRLIGLLYPTTRLHTEEVHQQVQEGDKWSGSAFETIEIGWIPGAVFKLPGVVPFRDGRPMAVVSSLTCVLVDMESRGNKD